ncbi:hypothetical protein EDC04DRAFT_2607924 [Pisolithus marmoratus]|nr:hypothetical protein EDC04DRAFT_2607924 [Pisolithus marmoratus]
MVEPKTGIIDMQQTELDEHADMLKVPDKRNKPTRQNCGHSVEFVPKMCLRQDQSLPMSGQTASADPECCKHRTPVTVHMGASQVMTGEMAALDKITSMNDMAHSQAEKRLLASSGDWYTGCKVKWLNGLPVLPKPPQSYIEHLPRLYMVTHQHGRLKTNAEMNTHVATVPTHDTIWNAILESMAT